MKSSKKGKIKKKKGDASNNSLLAIMNNVNIMSPNSPLEDQPKKYKILGKKQQQIQ